MTEARSSSTNADEPLTGFAYAWAYLNLFFAHWFGAQRFARVGHPEAFDPEDVQAYSNSAQKYEHLKKNFLRSQRVVVTTPVATASESTAETEQPENGAETQVAQGGIGALGDDAVEARAPADQSEAGQPAQPSQAGAAGTEVRIVPAKQGLPWFVIIQSLLMCFLWGVFALKKAKDDATTGTDPWLAGLDSISRGSTDLRWSGPNCEDYRAEIWRWFTYQWTHIGVVHVLANTIVLIVFGWALEGHEGSLRMFIIFNTGVIGGALCWFVGGAHGYVVGTSGGVYALIGLHFEDLIMNWRERHFRRLVLCILLTYVFLDVLTWGLSQNLTKADYSYSVAIGGGLSGLIMGSFIGRNYVVTLKDKRLMAGLSFLAGMLLVFSLLWLSTHEAPVNIWEASSVEGGWCWVGQFRSRSGYLCVRCATEECVQEWKLKKTMLSVSAEACEAQGWHFDER
mmetsp:Transcript_139291/g.347242  ORF Transcript_139291/g.347242 Transcript_139291/m.347242 type:complete len:454 (-) Transcript_139291:109-1470(-)